MITFRCNQTLIFILVSNFQLMRFSQSKQMMISCSLEQIRFRLALLQSFRQYNYMQAFSNTIKLSHYMPECPEDIREDEGFAQEEIQSLIVPKQEAQDDLSVSKPRSKNRILYREPKIKLVYVTKQKDSRQQLRKSLIQKQSKSLAGKYIQFPKRQSRRSLQTDLLAGCVTRIKRACVGENITIPVFGFVDSKAIKSYIMSSGATLVYEKTKETNTHGYIRKYSQGQNNKLLQNELNQLLKIKLQDSFVMPKKSTSISSGKSIFFDGYYEAGNLQFVSQTAERQYEIFLRNDTNTHGHQSWFLFKILNNKSQSQTINLNICNIKRNLVLFNEGANIYKRKIDSINEIQNQWQFAAENIQFKTQNNPKFANCRVHKLSFSLTLEPEQQIQIALLPSYSYTDLMNEIKSMSTCQYLTVETLTYSLVGFAIPILTFTRGGYPHKNVILVSCRVHPGETNSSFMCRGLMKWLNQDNPQTKDFLQKHIVKIIPMINPDGVVFGNFRTNFLGADLNRSFDSQDQITNPQICALKQLGLKLKQEYGQRFNIFLDLHGHSSQKNVFSYGPDYQRTETNFYQVRLLPKILNLRSKMFKYSSCTFKLQDYKRYTARGFFLNTVDILAYTVEASYAFYQDEAKLVSMGCKEWIEFGGQLGEGLAILAKINKISSIRNRSDIKKALGQADKQQIEIIKKFKREFKHQKQNPQNITEKIKEKNVQDSDAQSQVQDYTRVERDQLIRRVSQTMVPNMILPRVLKHSIIYPTVTPKLFKYRQQFQQTNIKILYTKRSYKYSGMRMPGNGYIHSLKGLQLSKP